MTLVRKRDGDSIVEWNPIKIQNAMRKAFEATKTTYKDELLAYMTAEVVSQLGINKVHTIDIETIQDVVERTLCSNGYWPVARAYVVHRTHHAALREGRDELMDIVEEIDREATRDNANVGNTMAGKVLQISEAASGSFYSRRVIPKKFNDAHMDGDIHIHDKAWYGKGLNCCQIPFAKLAKNGFNTGHGWIRPANSTKTAAMHASIMIQANQNEQYGGQSFSDFDNEYVESGVMDRERIKIREEILEIHPEIDRNRLHQLVEQKLDKNLLQAMEALVYNLNTMHSRGGGQVPFSSLNIGRVDSLDAARVCKSLLLAYEKGLGKGEQPIFPNICFKLKAGLNMYPEDPYFELFALALRVAGRRLNPSWVFCDSSFNKKYEDVAYMGCRTRVLTNQHGEEIVKGRGNIAFTTENIPRLAIKALIKYPNDEFARLAYFFELHEEMLDLMTEQLLHRFDYLCKTLKAKDFPFLFGQGLYMDSDDLNPEDSIYKAARHGTLSYGFIGIAEALIALIGKHHAEDKKALEIAHQIAKMIQARAERASKEHHLNFSVIGTPAEGLSGRFTKLDKKKYGIIHRVTDRDFYTNSFHVPVDYEIDIFNKISIEGPFHKYCNGGHISYGEVGSVIPAYNIEALRQIIYHMAKSDMGYAAVNFPVDICKNCFTDTNIILHGDPCPVCGEVENIDRVRRITGYLSTLDRFNDAKQAEEKARVSHV